MTKNIYQRFADRIAAEPGYVTRATTSPAELSEWRWIDGEWTWEMRIHSTATTSARLARGTYRLEMKGFSVWMHRAGEEAMPYLTYDAFQRRWVLSMIDRLSYGIITGRGWQENIATFEGVMTFMGVELEMRQTWHRHGDNEIRIINEERLDGDWRVIDEIICLRAI